MKTFNRILFPVDFSDRSRQTAHLVAWIARKFQSKVTLLHVLPAIFAAPMAPESYGPMIRQHRETLLAEFGTGVLDGIAIDREIEQGDAAGAIVHCAKNHDVDVIVIPTHGQGIFRRLLIGSVTAKVLHDSACPVLTTMHAETLLTQQPNDVSVIVCGVDPYSAGAPVIKQATTVAQLFGASVCLVHAIVAPEAALDGSGDSALGKFLLNMARERIATAQKDAGTDWPVTIECGAVAAVMRDVAKRLKADLVVAGRGHLHSAFGRFHANIGGIIQQAPCPVLSF